MSYPPILGLVVRRFLALSQYTMNRNTPTILIPLCVGLLVVGCQKPPATAPVADVTPTPPPTTPIPAPPQPIVKAATPEPETPEPAPPAAPVLAPPGVFFLTSRISVSTDDGFVGLPPGTRVVKQADGRYLADGHTLEIPADQLTNDLGVAAQITAGEKAARAQIAAANAAAQAAAQAAQATRQAPPPQPDAGQPNNVYGQQPPAGYRAATPSQPAYVPGVSASQSSLHSSTSLGAAHSKTSDGILWQKSPDGRWWVPVKRLNGKELGYVPQRAVQ